MLRHDFSGSYKLRSEVSVVLGSGKPLFKNIKGRHNLFLANNKAFKSGVVLLYLTISL